MHSTVMSPCRSQLFSAELSHSSKVSDRRRNTLKLAQNRSDSLCDGLWVPCRVFWAWFGPALGSNPARNRRFPARSFKVFGAILAQPSCGALESVSRVNFVDLCSIFQAGALGNGPGPNFGRKPTQNQPQTDPKPIQIQSFQGPFSSSEGYTRQLCRRDGHSSCPSCA